MGQFCVSFPARLPVGYHLRLAPLGQQASLRLLLQRGVHLHWLFNPLYECSSMLPSVLFPLLPTPQQSTCSPPPQGSRHCTRVCVFLNFCSIPLVAESDAHDATASNLPSTLTLPGTSVLHLKVGSSCLSEASHPMPSFCFLPSLPSIRVLMLSPWCWAVIDNGSEPSVVSSWWIITHGT